MAPASSIPPALPPSVEEAYRRKCVQLKQRTAEVEEANDAARLRLSRLKRQVEKMRLERAFLLEQLSRRTSTNVEDSDGSPSPPPTPKEKPLRIKRGHRKPSMLANLESTPSAAGGGGGGGATFISQNLGRTQSPSSDTFSTQNQDGGGKLNGVHSAAPKKPGNAFELYCDETRESLKEKNKDEDGDINMEEELARGWKDLDDSQREEFKAREERELTKYHEEKKAYDQKQREADEAAAAAAAAAARESQNEEAGDKTITDMDHKNGGGGGSRGGEDVATEEERDDGSHALGGIHDDDQTSQPGGQEDVEMGNYDTDQETQGDNRLEE